MKNIKISKKLLALAMAGSIGLSTTGCDLEPEYEEYKAPTDSYDLLNTTEENTTNSDEFDNVINGVEQILDVSGENFKLKINYSSPEAT